MTEAQRNLFHVLMGSFPGISGELAEELTDAVIDFVKNAMSNPDAAPFRETLDRARAALDKMEHDLTNKCPADTSEGCDIAGKCRPGHECAEPCTTCAACSAAPCDKTPPVQPGPNTDTAFERNPDSARGHILREAYNIINGERQDMYGKPEDSFALIARFWNVYLDNRHVKFRGVIKPRDVAMLMALLKIARYVHRGDEDSLRDLAGYTGLAGSL